jgi:hypothetical protein
MARIIENSQPKVMRWFQRAGACIRSFRLSRQMPVMLARATDDIGVQNLPDDAPLDQHVAHAATAGDTAK